MVSLIAMLIVGVCGNPVTANAASGSAVVYLTKTGDCYHLDGCSCLRRSKIATTLQEAVNKGYYACLKCNSGTLDAASTAPAASAPAPSTPATTKSNAAVAAPAQAAASVKTTPAVSKEVEALKTYSGNTNEFNAYTYYTKNADLQTAIGADGAKLLAHFKNYGKKEGRVAITADQAAVEALKTYKGNSATFNAYTYYTSNADLQTAIGADGDKLLAHYNNYGMAEKRKAKKVGA